MTAVDVIAQIQSQKLSEVSGVPNPELDAEGQVVMELKRMSIDEPPLSKKADPLR